MSSATEQNKRIRDKLDEVIGDYEHPPIIAESGEMIIGTTLLTIPPSSIDINVKRSVDIHRSLRSESVRAVDEGISETKITLSCIFATKLSINGKTQNTIDELRDLLAQFRATPFTKIQSPELSDALNIEIEERLIKELVKERKKAIEDAENDDYVGRSKAEEISKLEAQITSLIRKRTRQSIPVAIENVSISTTQQAGIISATFDCVLFDHRYHVPEMMYLGKNGEPKDMPYQSPWFIKYYTEKYLVSEKKVNAQYMNAMTSNYLQIPKDEKPRYKHYLTRLVDSHRFEQFNERNSNLLITYPNNMTENVLNFADLYIPDKFVKSVSVNISYGITKFPSENYIGPCIQCVAGPVKSFAISVMTTDSNVVKNSSVMHRSLDKLASMPIKAWERDSRCYVDNNILNMCGITSININNIDIKMSAEAPGYHNIAFGGVEAKDVFPYQKDSNLDEHVKTARNIIKKGSDKYKQKAKIVINNIIKNKVRPISPDEEQSKENIKSFFEDKIDGYDTVLGLIMKSIAHNMRSKKHDIPVEHLKRYVNAIDPKVYNHLSNATEMYIEENQSETSYISQDEKEKRIQALNKKYSKLSTNKRLYHDGNIQYIKSLSDAMEQLRIRTYADYKKEYDQIVKSAQKPKIRLCLNLLIEAALYNWYDMNFLDGNYAQSIKIAGNDTSFQKLMHATKEVEQDIFRALDNILIPEEISIYGIPDVAFQRTQRISTSYMSLSKNTYQKRYEWVCNKWDEFFAFDIEPYEPIYVSENQSLYPDLMLPNYEQLYGKDLLDELTDHARQSYISELAFQIFPTYFQMGIEPLQGEKESDPLFDYSDPVDPAFFFYKYSTIKDGDLDDLPHEEVPRNDAFVHNPNIRSTEVNSRGVENEKVNPERYRSNGVLDTNTITQSAYYNPKKVKSMITAYPTMSVEFFPTGKKSYGKEVRLEYDYSIKMMTSIQSVKIFRSKKALEVAEIIIDKNPAHMSDKDFAEVKGEIKAFHGFRKLEMHKTKDGRYTFNKDILDDLSRPEKNKLQSIMESGKTSDIRDVFLNERELRNTENIFAQFVFAPGVKIKVRLGYGSVARHLETQFNGVISESSPGKTIRVVAQNYFSHLTTSVPGSISPPSQEETGPQIVASVMQKVETDHIGRVTGDDVYTENQILNMTKYTDYNQELSDNEFADTLRHAQSSSNIGGVTSFPDVIKHKLLRDNFLTRWYGKINGVVGSLADVNLPSKRHPDAVQPSRMVIPSSPASHNVDGMKESISSAITIDEHTAPIGNAIGSFVEDVAGGALNFFDSAGDVIEDLYDSAAETVSDVYNWFKDDLLTGKVFETSDDFEFGDSAAYQLIDESVHRYPNLLWYMYTYGDGNRLFIGEPQQYHTFRTPEEAFGKHKRSEIERTVDPIDQRYLDHKRATTKQKRKLMMKPVKKFYKAFLGFRRRDDQKIEILDKKKIKKVPVAFYNSIAVSTGDTSDYKRLLTDGYFSVSEREFDQTPHGVISDWLGTDELFTEARGFVLDAGQEITNAWRWVGNRTIGLFYEDDPFSRVDSNLGDRYRRFVRDGELLPGLHSKDYSSIPRIQEDAKLIKSTFGDFGSRLLAVTIFDSNELQGRHREGYQFRRLLYAEKNIFFHPSFLIPKISKEQARTIVSDVFGVSYADIDQTLGEFDTGESDLTTTINTTDGHQLPAQEYIQYFMANLPYWREMIHVMAEMIRYAKNSFDPTSGFDYSNNQTEELKELLVDIAQKSEILRRMPPDPRRRPFRQHHATSSSTGLLMNSVRPTTASMWNGVRIKYDQRGGWGGAVGELGDFTKNIFPNSSEEFVKALAVLPQNRKVISIAPGSVKELLWAKRTATSYLADGLRRMYQGNVIMVGNERIKPHDHVQIMDAKNNMFGPVEVDEMTLSFDLRRGFITDIKPCMIVQAHGDSDTKLERALNGMFGALEIAGAIITIASFGTAGGFVATALAALKTAAYAATLVGLPAKIHSAIKPSKSYIDVRNIFPMASGRTKTGAIDTGGNMSLVLDDITLCPMTTDGNIVQSGDKYRYYGGKPLVVGLNSPQAAAWLAEYMDNFSNIIDAIGGFVTDVIPDWQEKAYKKLVKDEAIVRRAKSMRGE